MKTIQTRPTTNDYRLTPEKKVGASEVFLASGVWRQLLVLGLWFYV